MTGETLERLHPTSLAGTEDEKHPVNIHSRSQKPSELRGGCLRAPPTKPDRGKAADATATHKIDALNFHSPLPPGEAVSLLS